MSHIALSLQPRCCTESSAKSFVPQVSGCLAEASSDGAGPEGHWDSDPFPRNSISSPRRLTKEFKDWYDKLRTPGVNQVLLSAQGRASSTGRQVLHVALRVSHPDHEGSWFLTLRLHIIGKEHPFVGFFTCLGPFPPSASPMTDRASVKACGAPNVGDEKYEHRIPEGSMPRREESPRMVCERPCKAY